MFFFLLFITISSGSELKQPREKYFRAIFNMPKDCTLKTEPGIVAFIDSGYVNYPMLLKMGSNKTSIEFYDVTHTLIEDVNIEGLKKTQIENLLEKIGIYL